MTPPSNIRGAVQQGPLDASQHLNIAVSLAYRDPVGMQAYVDSASNPRSNNYRHYLTPAEIGKRFGPMPQTIAKVESYLQQNGISIRLVGANGLTILGDGTASQAETAFHTQLFRFTSSADGYVPSNGPLFSYVTTPSMPGDLQPYVVDVSGLENFSHPHPCGYVTPPQIQTLYDLAPMYSQGTQGQGRTIAISSWDGYRLSNVPFEYSMFGLPAPSGGVGSNITVVTLDGGSGAGSEEGEADLDIQSILGVAPLCNLVIYDGSGGDLINVLTREANDDKADVISESYGWTLSSSGIAAAHNLHLSMSAEGITYMAASGDSGTTLSYYYPDIEPEVLLVGGTTVGTDSAGNRTSETGWSDGGGGWKPTSDPSNVLPSYQVGTGVPTNIPYRLGPDIALDADPNSGYVVYLNSNYYIIGGTSGASPTCAGSLGDSEQQLITNGVLTADSNGHCRFGRIQDLLYSFNGNSSVFYDVTSGSNGTLPNGQTSNAGPGWDFNTGWGAMDFNGFVTTMSGTGLTSFTVSPTSVQGGTSPKGTVTMATVAPTGGVAITLSGGDSSVSYPATVTIPAGSRSTTFTITTSAVSSTDTENLTATQGQTTKNASVTLQAATVTKLTFAPTSAVGGNSFTGTVTISQAAPASGVAITLSGGDSNVSHPSTVTVASGKTTASFTMTSQLVSANDSETITATSGSSSQSATVTLTPLSLSSLTISPASVVGGVSATGTVTLSAAAPTGGVAVSLSGGDSTVGYPASVTVPGTAKTVTFKITSTPVSNNDLENLTATLGSVTKGASLTVTVPAISSFTISPTSVFGGASAAGTVTLNGAAAAGGATVNVSGGDSYISRPTSVAVAAGKTSATFTITTTATIPTTDTETLHAQLYGPVASAALTVKPAGVVSSLTFSPVSITGGNSSTGTVKLAGAAGPSGCTVTLSGGDSNVGYPGSVHVAANGTSVTFTVTSSIVSAADPEKLTESYGSSSASGTLTVGLTTATSLTFSPTAVYGGVSSTGTITLSGPAGSSGDSVALSGGDSSVSYPSTVTVGAGQTKATFTVATSQVPSARAEALKATLNGGSGSGTLTLNPEGVVSTLTFSPTSILGGKSGTGTVKLTGPAGPTGVTVTLAGGDSSVSYPSSVTIAAGASSATFTVTSSAVSANDLEALTATFGLSSAKGSLTVAAPTVAGLSFLPTTVQGGTSITGTITLAGPAGPSGAVVRLSGGDTTVGYPATVTVSAGSTTATFTVTTASVTATKTEKLTATLGTATSSSFQVHT